MIIMSYLLVAVDICAYDMLYSYGDIHSMLGFGTPLVSSFQTYCGLGNVVLLMDSTVSTEEVAGDGCTRGKEILRLIYC